MRGRLHGLCRVTQTPGGGAARRIGRWRSARVRASACHRRLRVSGCRTLPVVLAYVQACGGDPQEWEVRWREAARGRGCCASRPRRVTRSRPTGAWPARGRGTPTLLCAVIAPPTALLELVSIPPVHRGVRPLGQRQILPAARRLIPRLPHPGPDPDPPPAALRVLAPGAHPAAHSRQRLVPRTPTATRGWS